MKTRFFFLLLLSLFSLSLWAQPVHEFRGVWMATVDNIDWPNRNDFNPATQRAEYIRQLNIHQRNGMNVLIGQVRPATDAFYPSPYEPWSQWLTGVQGKPPAPYYDPMAFMIKEAHQRGFEFHAWCNPYRANFNIGKASIAPHHITKLYPEWFLEYGGKLYFDPGNKEGQRWVVNVIRDMVHRYDMDAIHLDDYFYPYRIPGKEFPDTASYRLYGAGMSKDDWRRSNTDSIILAISKAIKEEKPWVKFGISPFGVWRNNDKDPMGSPTRAGVTNYDDLYADVLLWTRNGWIDYITPQLYWEIGHKLAPYEKLVEWWSRHTYGRHLYIGHGIYHALEKNNRAWQRRDQLPRQIDLLRQYSQIQGSVYFSSRSFDRNPNGWNDSLQNNYYRERVGVPPMEWLPKKPE
jgi:uncharacterized lipoprotein YddW (UPF0748 family)